MGPLIIHKAVTVISISSTGGRTDGPAGITEGSSIGARGPEKENELRKDIKEKFEELPGWAHPDFPEQAKNYWQHTRGLDSQSAIDLGVKWQQDTSVLNLPEALIMPSRDDEGELIYLSGSNLKGQKCHPTGYKKRPLRSPHKTKWVINR